MKQFFKFVFASCLGVFLAGVVFFLISSAVVGGMIAKESKGVEVKPNTVLELTFADPIPERTNNIQPDFSEFKTEATLGLHDIVKTIEAAKKDDAIKGVFLNLNGTTGGMSTKTVLRDALNDFKESGKFVVSYSKSLQQGDYYLASVADKVYLNPLGDFDFRGFGAQVMFFKNMLDNLGIDMQVFYAGKFKGASEPFRRTDLSKENRLQIREYINGLYDIYLNGIADARGLTKDRLFEIANNMEIRHAEDALLAQLIDVVGYYDEAVEEMRVRMDLDEDDKFRTVSLTDYHKGVKSDKSYRIKDRIAIVYAEGGINTGSGEPATIGDEQYMKILRKLKNDDKIKAVVLRVNSGGGSALASENIWREVNRIKEAGKPVVVSMGDVAASGGYYISCAADKIFAEESTITGSIGVVAAIPSTEELMNEELGITFDTVSTGRFSNSFTPVYDMEDEEKEVVQKMITNIYDVFLKRVSEGRSIPIERVKEIAQGRVWTGNKAKEIGLVDELGGLEDAIAEAQALAALDEYRLREFPEVKEPIEQLLENVFGEKDTRAIQAAFVQKEFKELYPYYKKLKTLHDFRGVQMRMPFDIEVQY